MQFFSSVPSINKSPLFFYSIPTQLLLTNEELKIQIFPRRPIHSRCEQNIRPIEYFIVGGWICILEVYHQHQLLLRHASATDFHHLWSSVSNRGGWGPKMENNKNVNFRSDTGRTCPTINQKNYSKQPWG